MNEQTESTEPEDMDALAEEAYASLGEGADEAEEYDEDEAFDPEEGDDAEGYGEDPLALDEAFAAANPAQAEAYEERVARLRYNEAALAPILEMEAAFADPSRVGETLRGFAEALAAHHGMDFAEMFGSAAAPGGEAYGEDEYLEAGYDSPGELRLAQELAALRSQVAPMVQAQQRGRFEAAVRSVAPQAIASLRAEHGFAPTEAQALEAAVRFPELAAQDLRSAILAAFPLELARHYAASASGRRPGRPEMPDSQGRRGHVAPDPESDSYEALADHVYATL